MNQPAKFIKSKLLSDILGENFSPVARMRLFSRGVQPNNRLSRYGLAAADKGCLACGNCIDACPVVREKERFQWQQNKRTSMALEAIVGDDCRRCYRCVRSCPQVSKDTKEYVFGFRRTEKFIHVLLAGSIFTLMATGIFLYHYRADIPTFDAGLLGWLHTLAGVLLMLVPILYWKMANGQFRRLLKNSWQWNREADKAWWEEFKAFLRHPVGKVLPHWREFNPYHKFWVCYLCVAIPLLAVTGIINFFSPTMPGEGGWAVFYAIHSLVALCTDLLIITHLYFKLLRFLIRTTADMYKSWKKTSTFHYPFIYDQKKSS